MKIYLKTTTTGCVKNNEPLCFLYILAPTATEMIFFWQDRGDPTVRLAYKSDSEQCMIYIQNSLVHQFLEMLFLDKNVIHNLH